MSRTKYIAATLLGTMVWLTLPMNIGRAAEKSVTSMTPTELQDFANRVWAKEREPEFRGRKFRDLPAYCRRTLEGDEKRLVAGLLKVAKDVKRDYAEREHALNLLGDHPHISMVEDLAKIAKEVPPKKRPWEEGVAVAAVYALACIADERVIPLLIEALGHPNRTVRFNALDRLHSLMTLPEAYITGKEFDDANQRQQVVADLRAWWEKNKGKVKAHWENAWWVR
jgi:hypothetical protein